VKRLLIAVVFVVSVLGLTTALTATTTRRADAVAWRVTDGVFFNVPRSRDPEKVWRIEQQIIAAINHAQKGSQILVSVFSFDREPVAEALIRARRRGVQVRVLMNNHQTTRAMRMMYRVLGKDRTKLNFAYPCRWGCRSSGENLHSKFFLFSHTGASRNVVMVGSTNLTFNAASNQFNDLYVRSGSQALYDTFVTLHEQMRLDRLADPLYWSKQIGNAWNLQVLPYPEYSATNDPVMKIFNKVVCTGATGGTGSNGRTRIRVSMHAWDGARGVYIAKKLRILYGAGCDVKLFYGMAAAGVRNVFATKTPRGYLPVHVAGYDTAVGGYTGEIDLYDHQKIIAISGVYAGDTAASYTFTGSSNFQDSGAKGDEVILRIKGAYLQSKYLRNWNYIWTERSHLARYIPYRSARTSGQSFRTADAPVPSPGGPYWEND
jgi:phosphatidylserine/phosphatidylglycerophosphate/cardiolipin synthase-like enzyme